MRDFETINRELREFNPAILSKPTLIVGSKLDAMDDQRRLVELRKLADDRGLEMQPISSATGLGIEELKFKVAKMLEASPKLQAS